MNFKLTLFLLLLSLNASCQKKIAPLTNLDKELINLLYKVLKKKNQGQDCVCSKNFKNCYPVLLSDSVYESSILDDYRYFFLNMENAPFTENDLLCENLEIEIQKIGTRPLKTNFPKKKKRKDNQRPYYEVKMGSPFKFQEKIYAIFYIEEKRIDKKCTPINLFIAMDSKGKLLNSQTETFCD